MRLIANVGMDCFFAGGGVIIAGMLGMRGPVIDQILALGYFGLNLIALICCLILGVSHAHKLLTHGAEPHKETER